MIRIQFLIWFLMIYTIFGFIVLNMFYIRWLIFIPARVPSSFNIRLCRSIDQCIQIEFLSKLIRNVYFLRLIDVLILASVALAIYGSDIELRQANAVANGISEPSQERWLVFAMRGEKVWPRPGRGGGDEIMENRRYENMANIKKYQKNNIKHIVKPIQIYLKFTTKWSWSYHKMML